MFTVKELAEFLKVSTITVYRLTESKKISSRKVGGQLRFTKDDIAKYLGISKEDVVIGQAPVKNHTPLETKEM